MQVCCVIRIKNNASKMHLILMLIVGFVIPVLPRNTPFSLCDRPEMTQCDLQDLKIYLLTNFSLLDFSRPVWQVRVTLAAQNDRPTHSDCLYNSRRVWWTMKNLATFSNLSCCDNSNTGLQITHVVCGRRLFKAAISFFVSYSDVEVEGSLISKNLLSQLLSPR